MMASINIHLHGVPVVTTGRLSSSGRRWIYLHVDDNITLHLYGDDEEAVTMARAWAASLTEAADHVEREMAAHTPVEVS